MSDVSCRMFEMYERGAAELGIPPQRLLERTTLSLDVVRNKRNRAPWSEWLVICNNFEAAIGGPEAMRRWGTRAMSHDYVRHLRRVAGSMMTPELLYRAAVAWLAPVLYPHLRFSIATNARRVHVTIEDPSATIGAAAWFRLVEGSLAALPRLLDLPDARVTSDISDERAVYDITTGMRSPGRLSRFISTVRLATRSSTMLKVLEEIRRDFDESFQNALQSQREIQTILQGVPDPVVVVSEGTVIATNQSWRDVFGVAPGTSSHGRAFLDFVDPGHKGVGEGLLADTLQDAEVEVLMRRVNGEPIVAECTTSSPLHYRGRLARVLIVRDVTERREREAIIATAERVSQFGAMAAGIAHDINNPLTGVLGYIDLLEQTLDELPEGETRRASLESLAMIREGAGRVRKIASELVRFRRDSSDGEQRSAQIEETLDAVVGLARNEIRHRAVLVKDYGSTPHVALSSVHLGQVLLNLVVNAAQSIEPGRASANRITLKTREVDAEVLVVVRDTGAGIAGPDLARVFEPLFTTKTTGHNSGLGLSICKRIVAECGGRIELETEVGVGTEVRVFLPRADDAPAAPPAAQPTPATPALAARSLRVLVVDDEPVLRQLLRAYLSGHEVECAESGRAALRCLEADSERDLILCDVMMPDLTGVDVHATVQAWRPDLAERFVFVTGGAFGDETRAKLECLTNECLYKPFAREDIMRIVRTALARRGPVP